MQIVSDNLHENVNPYFGDKFNRKKGMNQMSSASFSGSMKSINKQMGRVGNQYSKYYICYIAVGRVTLSLSRVYGKDYININGVHLRF